MVPWVLITISTAINVSWITSPFIAGWWFQPLWKILVKWKYYPQYMEKSNMLQTTNQHIYDYIYTPFNIAIDNHPMKSSSPGHWTPPPPGCAGPASRIAWRPPFGYSAAAAWARWLPPPRASGPAGRIPNLELVWRLAWLRWRDVCWAEKGYKCYFTVIS